MLSTEPQQPKVERRRPSPQLSRAEQLYGPLGATQNDEENPGMKIGAAAPSLELPAVLTALETW